MLHLMKSRPSYPDRKKNKDVIFSTKLVGNAMIRFLLFIAQLSSKIWKMEKETLFLIFSQNQLKEICMGCLCRVYRKISLRLGLIYKKKDCEDKNFI